MEKKLPEDNLERFLRSSFKDFKQEPSDNLWSKIDAGLAAKPVIYKRIKPWMYWTAAASVLGFIIVMQFKSNQALNEKLEAILEQNQRLSQQTDKTIESSSSTSNENKILDLNQVTNDSNLNQAQNQTALKDLTAKGEKEIDPNTTVEEKSKSDIPSTDLRLDEKVKPLSPSAGKGKTGPQSAGKLIERQNQKSILEKDQLATNRALKMGGSKNQVAQNQIGNKENKRKQNSTIESNGNKQNTEKSNINSAIAENRTPIVAEPIEAKANTESADPFAYNRSLYSIVQLEDQNLNLLKSQEKETLIYSGLTMNPIQVNDLPVSKKGLELSVVGGALYESGEIRPKRFFDPRIVDFPNDDYNSNNSWTAGMELTKYLTNHWSIASGLSVKHFEFKNEFTQSLTFKNREQPNPGNLPFQHDFRCKLPGPTGTTDLIINSEQLDSRASISDAEEIKITIKNQSKLNYLTLPVSLAYQINKGKWSVFAKTGIQADLFLSRTVDEPQITLSHPQLQLRKNPPNKRPIDVRHTNTIVLNGLLSAGIKYQWTPQWSVSLNPGIILPFIQRESNRDIQVDSKIYSFQLGINYSLNSL